MAYRRKQSGPRNTTFEDERSTSASDEPLSLAAQAIRASSANRDSSLSSAYGESAFSSAYRESHRQRPSQDSTAHGDTSMNNSNESKYGFWGVLARKAKTALEDKDVVQDPGRNRPHMLAKPADDRDEPYPSSKGSQKMDSPKFQRGSESIASSLNYIGGTIKNVLEEGRSIVENKTAGIIQETRKLQIRRKSSGSGVENQAPNILQTKNGTRSQTDQESQLKASRDVASAMAAKAKLLLRELKTVKADLAFAKERCAQLEEENKASRESRQKGGISPEEDDDLIRLQLETLLAEKGRLAQENSVYARENRFLREIVEYHQLTMQDVVYLDEGGEEVAEVSPIHIPSHSLSLALHAPSPGFLSPSTNGSEPTTPPPDPVISSDPCPVVDMVPDSNSSSSPTAAGVSQQQRDSKSTSV